VERGEQETELILKIVKVGDLAVGEVRRFKDKPLRDVTPAPEQIEDNQVADKKTVGSAFKHRSDMD
jgi:polyhydroxyalkanoate synthesis regulator phasin